jgi:hypothetical protein
MTVQGLWQIDATGLPLSKNAFANTTAAGRVRSVWEFMTPPGSTRASKSAARALCRGTSTGNSSLHSVNSQAPACPCLCDTVLVPAPAWASALRGSVISTCPESSVTRKAILMRISACRRDASYLGISRSCLAIVLFEAALVSTRAKECRTITVPALTASAPK